MELQLVKKYDARAWDGVVVPLGEGNLNSYQGPWEQELAAVRASGRFEGKTGEIFRFSVLSEGVLTQIFLLGLGKDWSLEQVLENCAKVYRQCQELDLRTVCTDLRGVYPQFTPALFQKAAEAAALTGYRFDKYKTTPTAPGIETAAFLCEMPERYEAALVEAEVSAEATCIARDLINEPPTVLTPAKLAQAAQLCHAHAAKLFLPVVKCGFRNAHLSADFLHPSAGFGLFQRKCYLFLGIAGLFHGDVPLREMEERPETSV